jgi:hypothetical protein
MFPLMGLAAILLSNWISGAADQKRRSTKMSGPNPIILGLLWSIWLAPVLGSLYLLRYNQETMQEGYDAALLITAIVFVVGFLPGLIARPLLSAISGRRRPAAIVAAILLVLYAAIHLYDYADWVDHRQYTLITADRDLGALLNDDAVVSGSYATALTQENGLGCIHHMFGVYYLYTEFFRYFPITHLVVDYGNEQLAREDYPEIMSESQILTTHLIRGFEVDLIRVAPAAGNENALNYEFSDFEKARLWMERDNSDSAEYYLSRYIASDIPNYSGNMLAATSHLRENRYVEALEYLKRAYEFAPRDVLVNYYLGETYVNATAETRNTAYYDSALVHLSFCRKFISAEEDPWLTQAVEELKSR